MDIPDGDLFRLARDGDPAAFRLLVERHLPMAMARPGCARSRTFPIRKMKPWTRQNSTASGRLGWSRFRVLFEM